MKKTILAISIGMIGILILINGTFEETKGDMPVEQIEHPNTTETTTTSTITPKTTKVAKKTTKTPNKTKQQKVATGTKGEYQIYAKEIGGYDDTQMSCLINLWNRESGWNPNTVNKSSGACGIPQAHPCNKIVKQQGSNDWKAQIRWGINYITARYKTPCGAWGHFQNKGWY